MGAGDSPTVEEQIDFARHGAREIADPVARALVLAGIAHELVDRGDRDDDPAARTGAVIVGTLALGALPDGDIDLADASGNLLRWVTTLFDRGGDIRVVIEAGMAIKPALDRAEPSSRPECAQHHADFLFLFQRLGGNDTGPDAVLMLEDQIGAYRAAIDLAPDADPFPGRAMRRVGFLALRLYQLRRDAGELDLAIGACRIAAEFDTRTGNRDQAADNLFFLGTALRLRFSLHTEHGIPRDSADLDESIVAFRGVRAEAAEEDLRDAGTENLYTQLLHRFRIESNVADLDEIIAAHEADVERARKRPGLVHTAGEKAVEEALRLRGGITGDSMDAVMATLLGWFDPKNPHKLDNLTKFEGFTVRASKTRQQGRDDPALAAEIEPVVARLRAEPDLANRVDLLDQLVDALGGLQMCADSPQVMDELVIACEQLIAAIPASDVQHRLHHQVGLGAALIHRFRDLGGGPDDARRAVSAMEPVALAETVETPLRIRAAQGAAETAAALGDWATAARMYRQAVGLLNLLVPRHLAPTDHVRLLNRFSGLVTEAAAVLMRAGDAAGALEVLEQGRGLLIGHALDLHDGATERLRDIADQLAAPVDPHAKPPGGESRVDRARALSRQWDREVERIRSQPGFEDYLIPPRVSDLAPFADRGPLITVLVGSHGAHALVLTTSGVEVVDLPGLTPQRLVDLVDGFWGPLRFAELAPDNAAATESAQAPLRQVLADLWDLVAAPVLDRLDPRTRRVWWIPTGLLTVLPLHAAGKDGVSVLDRVISSYAPTLKVLRATRRPRAGGRAATVVSVTDAPDLPPLHLAAAEADAVGRRLRHGLRRPLRLDGPAASPDAVLRAVRDSGWLHLACHASTVAADPASSALHLHHGKVTAQDVLAAHAPGGRLAYLSACSTAQVSSAALADETIHLASAFQIAGFRNVVGTLWRVDDGIAAHVAESFYAALDRHEDRSAEALHQAVLALRRQFPLLPARWASYIHFGG